MVIAELQAPPRARERVGRPPLTPDQVVERVADAHRARKWFLDDYLPEQDRNRKKYGVSERDAFHFISCLI